MKKKVYIVTLKLLEGGCDVLAVRSSKTNATNFAKLYEKKNYVSHFDELYIIEAEVGGKVSAGWSLDKLRG